MITIRAESRADDGPLYSVASHTTGCYQAPALPFRNAPFHILYYWAALLVHLSR